MAASSPEMHARAIGPRPGPWVSSPLVFSLSLSLSLCVCVCVCVCVMNILAYVWYTRMQTFTLLFLISSLHQLHLSNFQFLPIGLFLPIPTHLFISTKSHLSEGFLLTGQMLGLQCWCSCCFCVYVFCFLLCLLHSQSGIEPKLHQ